MSQIFTEPLGSQDIHIIVEIPPFPPSGECAVNKVGS